MITIRRYNYEDCALWDAFVDASKNGTFMLKRSYMDYHSDRFKDHSLMFYKDDELVALLPATHQGTELRSHGGLTYGGLITNLKMTVQLMLSIFDALREYGKIERIDRIIYKRVPTIYYTYPSDEDLYALFRFSAKLIRRDISTTIYLPNRIRLSERRRRGVKKALKNGIVVKESSDYQTYIDLVSDVLRIHHNAKPVHTSTEISLLASRFPENIKLYAAYKDDKMLAGVLMFLTPKVAHAQYIANSEIGREFGALDVVMDYLINDYYLKMDYFDFGISTENDGLLLNEGLISQKQEFGGRGIVYDTYEYKL